MKRRVKMDNNYIELKDNTWAISKSNYDALQTNAMGCKLATGQPNGLQLEVFDESTGKIVAYAEAINNVWYER